MCCQDSTGPQKIVKKKESCCCDSEDKTQPNKAIKKASCCARVPDSAAKGYVQSFLHKVATNIVVDEEAFMPTYMGDSPTVSIRAKLDGPTRLPHRAMQTIDCGFSMELPPGYKAVFEAAVSLKAKGMFVVDSTSNRVTVTVLNAGREIVPISNGDVVAEMSIQPVYLFDWMVK
jgi:dUTPase